jgi:hypothetical protein
MTLEYRPTTGLIINGKELNWGDDRQFIRKTLAIKYSDDDRVIDLASFTGGDTSQDIQVKRDIYGNFDAQFSFHLNYDVTHKLESIEIHRFQSVQVETLTLVFNTDIDEIQRQLQEIDPSVNELDSGEFFFPNIKVVVASQDVMGGDGSGFTYFYASNNVDHLFE